jgi:hypothetical protein
MSTMTWSGAGRTLEMCWDTGGPDAADGLEMLALRGTLHVNPA